MKSLPSDNSITGKIFRKLPHFKGKYRLARLIIPAAVKNGLNVHIQGKYGIQYMLPNIKEAIGFELFVDGTYESGLVRLLAESIPANGTFIDVGANIGAISIPLARLRPDISIVAIEASPWIYAVLTENIRLNNIKNIRTLNNAVYNESGKELPMYAPTELFGKGSLSPVFTKDAELVTTITIDAVKQKMNLGTIDFMKIDVEGYEICVFKGMIHTFKTSRPKIIFEFVNWAEKNAGYEEGTAQKFLLSQNYVLQKLSDKFIVTGTTLNEVSANEPVNFIASPKKQ